MTAYLDHAADTPVHPAASRASVEHTCVPNNAHLAMAGCSGEDLLYLLDIAGVTASSGSACHTGVSRTVSTARAN